MVEKILEVPEGDAVKLMVSLNGKVFVATEKAVYEVKTAPGKVKNARKK